jgi:hypothetical protein
MGTPDHPSADKPNNAARKSDETSKGESIERLHLLQLKGTHLGRWVLVWHPRPNAGGHEQEHQAANPQQMR